MLGALARVSLNFFNFVGHGCQYVGGLKSVMMLGLCLPQKSENAMYQEFDFLFFSPLLPLLAQTVKNLPVMLEILSQEDPLEMGIVPNPLFLPGQFHEQRSLMGYNQWGNKELELTE